MQNMTNPYTVYIHRLVIYVYIYICTFVYIYIYIYIHTHTHTHTRLPGDMPHCVVLLSFLDLFPFVPFGLFYLISCIYNGETCSAVRSERNVEKIVLFVMFVSLGPAVLVL